jgi:phosphopantetheine adenylyltransferase
LCHGVFDLVHLGHIEHFKSAKKFGDYFIGELINDYLKELEINISTSQDSLEQPSQFAKSPIRELWGATKNFLIDFDKNFDWYIKDETGHYYFVETFFGVYDEKESVKVYEEINIKLGGLSEEEIKKIRDRLLW